MEDVDGNVFIVEVVGNVLLVEEVVGNVFIVEEVVGNIFIVEEVVGGIFIGFGSSNVYVGGASLLSATIVSNVDGDVVTGTFDIA